MYFFTDRVLTEIAEHIGKRPPECGGALLVMIGSNVVAGFEADPQACTTGISYTPSPELTNRVRWREMNEGLSFCGVVHSHPGNFDQPSLQDDVAFRKGLDLNPHLAGFLAPIVTHDLFDPKGRADELLLGNPPVARMRSYVAHRNDGSYRTKKSLALGRGRAWLERWSLEGSGVPTLTDNSQTAGGLPSDRLAPDHSFELRTTPGLVRLRRISAKVMPLDAELARVIDELRHLGYRAEHVKGTVTEFRGQPFLNEVIPLGGGHELQILFATSFPMTRPIVLYTRQEGANFQTREHGDWGWSLDEIERPGFLWRQLGVLFGGGSGHEGRMK